MGDFNGRRKVEKFLRFGNPGDDRAWREFASSENPIPRDELHSIFAEAANHARTLDTFVHPDPTLRQDAPIGSAASRDDS